MNKSKAISEIFNVVLTKGIKTSKSDILGEDIDDKVYAKRININKDLDEKFEEALESSWGKRAILDVIESYYDTIKEYEEIVGY